jgi:hypothetical protein
MAADAADAEPGDKKGAAAEAASIALREIFMPPPDQKSFKNTGGAPASHAQHSRQRREFPRKNNSDI